MDLLTATGFVCGLHTTHEIVPFDVPAQPIAYFDQQPTEDRLEREHPDVPYSFSSEHFVIRWGDGQSFIDGFEERVAEDLEFAWRHQVDERGWGLPLEADVYKIDVYMGNTDPNVPSINFDGAYVTLDEAQTHPYIVVSPSIIEAYASDDYDPIQILSHEFNHTLQVGEGTYDGYRGQFWFEATANWAAADTMGGTTEVETWGPFLLHPEYALYSFQFIGDTSDPRRSQRQYNAAMFVRFLSDRHGVDLIRQSWDDADPQQDPFEWLDAALDDGFREEFVEFAVSHGVGDTPYARLYAEYADRFGNFQGREAVTLWLPPEGGAQSIDVDLYPEGYAWNRLVWSALEDSTLTFSFDADDEGDRDSLAEFVQVAVVEFEGEFTRYPIDDTLTLDVPAGAFVNFMLISVADDHRPREQFTYDYTIEVTRTEVDSGGCGCATSGPSASWGLLLLPALLRRRGGS